NRKSCAAPAAETRSSYFLEDVFRNRSVSACGAVIVEGFRNAWFALRKENHDERCLRHGFKTTKTQRHKGQSRDSALCVSVSLWLLRYFTKTTLHPATDKSNPSAADQCRASTAQPEGRLGHVRQCHPHRSAVLPSTTSSADTERCWVPPDSRQSTCRA